MLEFESPAIEHGPRPSMLEKTNKSISSSENNLPPSTPSSFKNLDNDVLSNDTSPSSTHIANNGLERDKYGLERVDPLDRVSLGPQQQSLGVQNGPTDPNGPQKVPNPSVNGVHNPQTPMNGTHPSQKDTEASTTDPQTGGSQTQSQKPPPLAHYNLHQTSKSTSNSQINTHPSHPDVSDVTRTMHSGSVIRRHTTNDLFQYKLETQSVSSHNTFLSKFKKRPSLDNVILHPQRPSVDSANTELSRTRGGLIKRNLTLKKLNKQKFYEDDKVLIGNKISEGHENFVMAYNMLTGIRVAVSRCSGIMKKLDDADFHSYKKLTFNFDGNEMTPSSKYDFKFKDYCPEVFRELRGLFGLDQADYLISITGKYILSELGSPGKSGSFFYYSRDFRYIIKTIHHSEHKQLRRILKDYYHHVKSNPNTLISQIYGLHRLKMPLRNGVKRKVHFIVMNNLFPPHREIHTRYDLKGSTWGRYTKSEDSTKPLKDLNWLEDHQHIRFGPNKRHVFMKQLQRDVEFLKSINVMDYLLLLGIHNTKKRSIGSANNKLTIFDPKSNNRSELIKTNPRYVCPDDLPSDVYPGRLKFIFYGHDGGIRSTNSNDEPESEIYYLGVIDFLTNYSLKKKLETVWRSLSHSRETILSVPAAEYGDRFLKFIKASVTKEKTD